jgi:NAD(P)-dependent dehydrogenase (short-subunit alcohol dehydrogenase family)
MADTDQKLIDTVCFVTGATGVVGSGILAAFLARGYTVVTCSRSQESLKKLAEQYASYGDRFSAFQGDIGSETDSVSIFERVKERFGVPKIFVSCLGAWWQKGPLTEQDYKEFSSGIHDRAGCHFVAAKAFLPAMKDIEGASYLIVTGAAGEKCFSAASSVTTVGTAALFGICLALRKECEKAAIRVNEFRIGVMVVGDDVTTKSYQINTCVMGKAISGAALDNQVQNSIVQVRKKAEVEEMAAKYDQ